MKHLIHKSFTLIAALILLALVFSLGVFASSEKNYFALSNEDAEACIGDTYFSTLTQALDAAIIGDVVRLEKNCTLQQNVTVPEGVTLLIPCMDSDPGYVAQNIGNNETILFNPNGTGTDGKTGIGPNAFCYRRLTVAPDATLTVNGTLLVNAVTGRTGTAGYDQDVTGGYGEIALDGEILVNGTLENFGFIQGSGTITANSGASVGDLYIVRHWRGGTHASTIYPYVYPMNEYDLHNIQTKLVIDSNATYTALVKMYANGQYYCTRFPQFDPNNGLIRLSSAAILTKTYKNGREHYSISGGASFASSTLTILNQKLSTGMDYFVYPIDGDIDFTLENGKYTVVNHFKFLPGAIMRVKKDASIHIAQGTILAFYDSFTDTPDFGATMYPSDRGAAMLLLQKGATLNNNGSFAGLVDADSDAVRLGNFSEPALTYPNIENGAWTVSTYEANGYNNSIPKKLNFELQYGHRITAVAPNVADCTHAGNEPYFRCDVCEKCFADAEGTQEIEDNSWVIAPLGHDLRYTASGAVITESCSRDSHLATATLTATDTVYTGDEATTAALSFDGEWLGGKPTISYENNCNAGTAIAKAAMGDAIAVAAFTIEKCRAYTLTLAPLNQYENQICAVSAELSPKDPTAKISVEYFVDEEWTTEQPTKIGSYRVRARITQSGNLVLSDSYTEALLTIDHSLDPLVIVHNPDGSIHVTVNNVEGDLLLLPLELTAVKSDAAKPISIDVAESIGSFCLEIPIVNLSENTVVVLLHEDGKEEILPKAIAENTAIRLDLDASVTIKIIDNEVEFADDDGWASKAIDFVTARGLFRGVADGVFDQDGTMTRAMLATVIHRTEGSPKTTTAHTFADVPDGEWFSDAITWANGAGIVHGYRPDLFGLNDPITREQMVAMLYRMNGSPNTAFIETGASTWAENAMSWAVSIGLIQGSEIGYAPKAAATRAEAAAILMRYILLTA